MIPIVGIFHALFNEQKVIIKEKGRLLRNDSLSENIRTLLPPFVSRNSRLYCKEMVMNSGLKLLSILDDYFLPYGQHME